MAIERSNDVSRPGATPVARERVGSESPGDTPNASGDRLDVSSGAREIGTLATRALESSDLRSDKVREIRERIDSGDYRVPSRALAASLIRNDVLA